MIEKQEKNKLYLYRVCKMVFTWLFCMVFRVRTVGRENVPESGGYVLCCNHRCVMDPVLLAMRDPRPVHFMAKAELFEDHGSFVAGFLSQLGAFPIHRERADRKSLQQAISLLKAGRGVGIFPEGHVMPVGTPFQAHPGAVMVAVRTASPIVPAVILTRRGARLFSKTKIRFAPPLDPNHLPGVGPDAPAKEKTEAAMRELERVMREMLQEENPSGEKGEK